MRQVPARILGEVLLEVGEQAQPVQERARGMPGEGNGVAADAKRAEAVRMLRVGVCGIVEQALGRARADPERHVVEDEAEPARRARPAAVLDYAPADAELGQDRHRRVRLEKAGEEQARRGTPPEWLE
jgi:hypothetical protein